MVVNNYSSHVSSLGRSARTVEIRQFILQNVGAHFKDIAVITARQFGISRQSVSRHLKVLVDAGLVEATGSTRAREYSLKFFVDESIEIGEVREAEEDVIWRERVAPFLDDLPPNVMDICYYGFTEMFNNVIDHSDSPKAIIDVQRSFDETRLKIMDVGVGIFAKLQQTFDLRDPRQALLELSKGKMTSDPGNHTGEGIFFTSRMFDEFSLHSGNLLFVRSNLVHDWILDVEEREGVTGTLVELVINIDTDRTLQGVFDEYASEEGDYSFTRTHVPVMLARYGEEQLVSRSQAKRLLTRFELFDVIVLDFKELGSIGQAFADEVFRVFVSAHPDIRLVPVNMSEAVKHMMMRSKSAIGVPPKT